MPHSQEQQQTQEQHQQPQDPKTLLENRKAKALKYKIYMFIMVVCFLFFWGSFASTMDQVKSLRTNLAQKETQLESIKSIQVQVQSDKSIIDQIVAGSGNMIKCMNDVKCEKTNKDLIRNFLLLTGNSSDKMDFDQKRILANINEFLINLDNGNKGGIISIITFNEPKEVNKQLGLWKVGITLSIDFPTNINFLNFLNNIEKKIDTKYEQNRALYKITSISYDIANYESAQKTSITMDAYFYK